MSTPIAKQAATYARAGMRFGSSKCCLLLLLDLWTGSTGCLGAAAVHLERCQLHSVGCKRREVQC